MSQLRIVIFRSGWFCMLGLIIGKWRQ